MATTSRHTSIASTSEQDIDLAHLRAPSNTSSKDRLYGGDALGRWLEDGSEGNSFYESHTPKPLPFSKPFPSRGLGIPTRKPWFYWLDLLALFLSLVSCSLAIAVVANDGLAWRLGVTYQLVVVGFLLSIMNLCLNYILPSIFLPLEARLGRSTLQNYEALLRNRPFTFHASWHWRIVLVLLAILPLGLSAGYKLFVGGTAMEEIKPDNEQGLYGNVFGMFAPPGMQPLGQNTGVTLMFNATTPFVQATTTGIQGANGTTYGNPEYDPPLPTFPQTYGFNTLLLNETSTAMLDAPPPAWVDRIRDSLGPGEVWNVSATVTATIATYNKTVDTHRDEYYGPENSTFWNYYGGQGGPKWSKLYNGWNIGLLTNYAISTNRDQSWAFLGIVPDPPNDNLTTFAPVAKMYDTVRTPCYGTWTITRGGILLVDGTCALPLTPNNTFARDQLILRNNQLAYPDWYLPILVEFLGPFATVRNQSRWLTPSVTTMVAGMVWSKVTAANGPDSLSFKENLGAYSYWDYGADEWRNTTDTGLRYESVGARIVSSRPTLRKSGGLFVLFAFQPVFMIAMLLFGLFLRDVPVGKGFGLVAVLAGLDRKGVDALEGAAFSGHSKEQVGLNVSVLDEGDGRGRVAYEIGPVGVKAKTRLKRGAWYR